MSYRKLVLRIRDPVHFLPLDAGSGMGKNQDPDPGCSSRIHLSESGLKIL
jgi:hypothetical protein